MCDTLGNAKEFNLNLGGVTAKVKDNALEINIDSIKQHYKEQYYNQYKRDSLMVSRDININSEKIKYKPTKWTYWSTFINFFLILAILAYFRYKFS